MNWYLLAYFFIGVATYIVIDVTTGNKPKDIFPVILTGMLWPSILLALLIMWALNIVPEKEKNEPN